jgi:hypothetical protein
VTAALREVATPSAASALPTSEPFLEKAELLVAHVTPGTTGSRIRAVERFDIG